MEACIWITLVLIHCLRWRSLSLESSYILLQLWLCHSRTKRHRTEAAHRWRRIQSTGDEQGVFMSCATVPLLLLILSKRKGAEDKSYLSLLSLSTSIVLTFAWEPDWRRGMNAMLKCLAPYSVLFSIYGDKENQGTVLQASTNEVLLVTAYLACWWVLASMTSSVLQKAVSRGEWIVVSNILAFATVEYAVLFSKKDALSIDHLYGFTAASGLLACSSACSVAGLFFKQNVLCSLTFIATTTLTLVELSFFMQTSTEVYPFPRCLFWMFGEFLWEVEDDSQFKPLPILMENVSRLQWLFYWFTVMVGMIPFAPASRTNPVVARKWFHLVALVLFVPTSLAAPKLQSISYAIALCVLMIVESTRCHIPWLNAFYKTYLDSNKEEAEDTTIVSHMGLIIGCAIPLWLQQWTNSTDTENLLPLLGVWTLGVGDAMGAVVGKTFGTYRWGHQNRTLEGSAAMLASLCVVQYLMGGDLVRWVPTVVFVTLLEAFTLQIDNMVLPLAGSAVALSV